MTTATVPSVAPPPLADPSAAAPSPKVDTAGTRRPSPWVSFAVRRGIGLVASVLALIIITFFMLRLLPGDPAVAVAGTDATTADVERVRHELGLDLPLLTQFGHYVAGVFTGNMGTSYQWGQPVITVISSRLPFTLSISLIAIAIVLLVAVPLGMTVSILTTGGRRSWLDGLFSGATGFVGSVPVYVVATLLVVLFAISLGWLPPAYSARQGWLAYILPIVALAIGPICTVSRVVRRETSVVLEQDYIRTAHGWRLPHPMVHLKYALPNLITTTLTLSGLILTNMLGSALITETVFGWPGLGSGVVQAILNKDYPVIQGIILFIGVIAAVLNVLIDLILGIIDPRTLGGSND